MVENNELLPRHSLKNEKSRVKKMLSNQELEMLIKQVENRFQPQWNRLEALERKISFNEELLNAEAKRPKTRKARVKRDQQA